MVPSAELAIKLLVLLPVCCLGPGLLIVGRLRLSPVEKLCCAFAASFIVVYLASFGLFCINAGTGAYFAASAVFAVMGLIGWRTGRMFLRHRRVRAILLAFAVLLVWHGLHMGMVRIYSGGDWQGDWQEHYQRTQYFDHQLPNDFAFLGVYALPARPPMMNVIAAFFCRQVGLSFAAFQLTFLFLNAWAFVPCCLLMGFFGRRAGRCLPVLVILFMLNPSIVQNATLTVTKAFTAGLVVLGVSLYLRRRLMLAAMALAAAILAHYSAVPYAMAVGLHCLYQIVRRRISPAKGAIAAFAALLLLATWFGWSVSVYGPRVTFLSNTTASGTLARTGPNNFHKLIYNLITTAIPHPLRYIPAQYRPFVPPHNWGDLRDYYFLMAQTTLPTMIGLTSGVVAIVIFLRYLLSSTKGRADDKAFWLFFVLFTYVVGVAANPGWTAYGNGYVTLQSLALIGVTLVAARLTSLRPAVFFLVWIGLAIDFAFGVLLEFDRESYVYPTITDAAGKMLMLPDYTLGTTGAAEYLQKIDAGYVFWGDRLATISQALEISSIVIALAALVFLWRYHASVRKGAAGKPAAL
jgi:hypothetical protein